MSQNHGLPGTKSEVKAPLFVVLRGARFCSRAAFKSVLFVWLFCIEDRRGCLLRTASAPPLIALPQ